MKSFKEIMTDDFKNIERGILLKAIINTKKETETEIDYENADEIENEFYMKDDFLTNLDKNIRELIEKEGEVFDYEKIAKSNLAELDLTLNNEGQIEYFLNVNNDYDEEMMENFIKENLEASISNTFFNEMEEKMGMELDETEYLQKVFLDEFEMELKEKYCDVNNEFYSKKADEYTLKQEADFLMKREKEENISDIERDVIGYSVEKSIDDDNKVILDEVNSNIKENLYIKLDITDTAKTIDDFLKENNMNVERMILSMQNKTKELLENNSPFEVAEIQTGTLAVRDEFLEGAYNKFNENTKNEMDKELDFKGFLKHNLGYVSINNTDLVNEEKEDKKLESLKNYLQEMTKLEEEAEKYTEHCSEIVEKYDLKSSLPVFKVMTEGGIVYSNDKSGVAPYDDKEGNFIIPTAILRLEETIIANYGKEYLESMNFRDIRSWEKVKNDGLVTLVYETRDMEGDFLLKEYNNFNEYAKDTVKSELTTIFKNNPENIEKLREEILKENVKSDKEKYEFEEEIEKTNEKEIE